MTSAAEPQSQAQSVPERISTVVEADPNIRWDVTEVLAIAADRSLRSALRRLGEAALWVVVVRSHDTGVYYYAYRWHELDELATTVWERLDWPLQDALDLHGWSSSACARAGRPIGAPHSGRDSPAAGRIVDFDAAGQIVAIGEYRDRFTELTGGAVRGTFRHGHSARDDDIAASARDQDSDFPLESFDLGPLRGGQPEDASPVEPAEPLDMGRAPEAPTSAGPGEPAEIGVTISAETKSEIEIGSSQRIDFRLELSSEAVPLAVSAGATARPDLPIVVELLVENDALEIVRSPDTNVDPPALARPSVGNFVVKGIKAGVSRLAVTFRQGGSELGVIGLAIEVVASGARPRSTQGRATAAPADPADDDKLAIMIEQRAENGKVFYRYTLHSEALNLQYEAFDSKALLDRGGGPAATAQTFVERIYVRVTQELKSYDDLKELQREARALGASLSRELFDPDVARRLWPLRDRVKLIQIRSWEPYIPWELVRLHNPDTDETDDRFLAEYNLVRTLTDREPVRRLAMEKWSYLAATFPMGSLPAVGAELTYFTSAVAPSLPGRSIKAEPIAATKDAFYDALAEGQFDVLHISCHAESVHQSIEDASLIIGDATAPGATKPHFIQVNTETVRNEAKLLRRRPLVFLNACETGRVGAVLTAWGGWPNVFVRAGAGAFVGAAWAVRDKPAGAFSTAFYEALWNDKTLAEAAGAARQAAKKFGDASWLAFKVYGHPRARRIP
jgi:CHAT domain